MARVSLIAFALLAHCGSRTDLGGAPSDSCTSVTPTPTCAPPVCTNGKCIATVSEHAQYGFAIDATHVFWSTPNALMRADKCGTNATVLVGCLSEISVRAQDAENVYFVVTVGQPLEETLFRIPKNGGQPVELASFDADIQSIAVEDDVLFLTVLPESPVQGRVVRMPASGGVETTLFTGRIEKGLAVGGHEVFFGSASDIMRMKDDGTALTTLADTTYLGALASTRAIVMDATFVYATGGCGEVQRVARDGSTAKSEMLAMVSQPNGVACSEVGNAIAVDDAFVYLAYGGDGMSSILRVPKTGGSFDALVAFNGSLAAFAVDSSGVFWNDSSLHVLTTP